MKVVLDTNILISALISRHGPPYRILNAWRRKKCALLTCPSQLEEVRRVSRYPKLRTVLRPHDVGEVVNRLEDVMLPEPAPLDHRLADPDDAWLLALAVAADARFLVTGDRRAGLLALGRIGNACILTANAFCAETL